MAETASLTPKQQRIYDFICQRIDDLGYPPTIRDIGKEFEIKSPNGVMCHLKALEKKGYIIRDGNSARAIRLTHKPASKIGLPFKGLVAAGSPIQAEAQDERLNLHDLFAGPGTFVLQVRGQSMIDNHIADGDYVVIRKQEMAANGERVVAVVDGEYTLKKFYRRNQQIELRPENGTMAPIVVEPGKDVRIEGVLVGVVRKC
ncbi:MAG TPA: transcriptional repressor LexA [Gemmataceae bacterium]|jgi:repressor LexA